jgi:hypothetical protein
MGWQTRILHRADVIGRIHIERLLFDAKVFFALHAGQWGLPLRKRFSSCSICPCLVIEKLVETNSRLLAILGVGFEIAVLIGNTIGSKILRNPGEIVGRSLSTGPVPQRAQD